MASMSATVAASDSPASTRKGVSKTRGFAPGICAVEMAGCARAIMAADNIAGLTREAVAAVFAVPINVGEGASGTCQFPDPPASAVFMFAGVAVLCAVCVLIAEPEYPGADSSVVAGVSRAWLGIGLHSVTSNGTITIEETALNRLIFLYHRYQHAGIGSPLPPTAV